jgi:uncharacterized membrane protein YvbJ
MTPETCPNCGAKVPRGAKACPECGSDEETGWSQAAVASGLDLPEEEFDYNDFVKREFEEKTPKPRGVAWFWWVVAVIVFALLLIMLLRL